MYAYTTLYVNVLFASTSKYCMVVVNLQQIGPVPHRFVSREDLACVLEAAEEIRSDTPEEELTQILSEWETGLTWRSLEPTPVEDAWYTRALLVLCLRGLRGEMAPDFYYLGTDN
jgi:hypothetical protein